MPNLFELTFLLGKRHHLGMVLNSLSHDNYIQSAAKLVAHGGWFVEIGKRGICNRSMMAVEQWHTSYVIMAMDIQCLLDPVWHQGGLQGLSRGGLCHELEPLPLHVFVLQRDVVKGFQLIQQAVQIGKVVVHVRDSQPTYSLRCLARLVVSGGTGGLGLLFAQWLLCSGAERLLLLSRSGRIAGSRQQHWGVLATGVLEMCASVAVELGDVGMLQHVNAVVGHGMAGLVHTAGILADAILLRQTQSGLRKVWQPKASAAWGLHSAGIETKTEMDLFVLFSSAVTLLGGVGQANYSASNACLDALTQERHALGLTGTSVQWGAWAGAGMAVESGVLEQLERQGIGALMEEHGVHVMDLVMRGAEPVVGAIPLRWPVLLGLMEGAVPTFLAGFMDQARAVEHSCQELSSKTVNGLQLGGLGSQLVGMDHEMLQKAVVSVVVKKVWEVAGVTAAVDESLMENGVDSLAATELQNLLQRELGVASKLRGSLLFEYPTVAEIAQLMASQMILPPATLTAAAVTRGTPGAESVPKVPGSCTRDPKPKLSAMTCRLAGRATTPQSLWSVLCAGICTLTHTPPRRWQHACKGAPAAVLCGGFVGTAVEDALAPRHSRILDSATQLDMNIELLLDTALEALQCSGNTWDMLKTTEVAVVTAATPSDFTLPTTGFNVARLVAAALRMSGRHQNHDFACSSGYLAIEHAMRLIEHAECGLAVVSGVSLLLKPDSSVDLYTMGILSPSGNMRPFDATADGMVWGEACGSVVLGPESIARQWHAKLFGAAASRNNALTPAGFVDAREITKTAADALLMAGIAPAELASTHPHGMGNPASLDPPSQHPSLAAPAAPLRPSPLPSRLLPRLPTAGLSQPDLLPV